METVKSADGTVIAYDRAGAGPALIVSVGAFCTRHTFVAPPELRQRFTVITYDRRGRGDSGDTQPFAPERELGARSPWPSASRSVMASVDVEGCGCGLGVA
jgi:pimeloyl-ACP methyl ester carboxylesterase